MSTCADWATYDRRTRAVVAAHPEIDHRKVFRRNRSSSSMDVYDVIDVTAIDGLNDFEIAALASGGHIPWGYRVDGPTVYIYTD